MRISDWSSDVCSSDLLMAWSLPWSRKPDASPVDAADTTDDAWARHVTALAAQGVAEPGSALGGARRRPAPQRHQIGRASCRARECPNVYYTVGGAQLNTQHTRRANFRTDRSPT